MGLNEALINVWRFGPSTAIRQDGYISCSATIPKEYETVLDAREALRFFSCLKNLSVFLGL